MKTYTALHLLLSDLSEFLNKSNPLVISTCNIRALKAWLTFSMSFAAANLETNYFITDLLKLLEKLFVSLLTVPFFNVLFYFIAFTFVG